MSGAKVFLVFLGGVVTGAAGLAYLNKNKMDFKYMKPVATDMLTKGINLKDRMMTKVTEMKENFEDMAAEARDKADAERLNKNSASPSKTSGHA